MSFKAAIKRNSVTERHIGECLKETFPHLKMVSKMEERDEGRDRDFFRRASRILNGPVVDWNSWAFLLEDDEGAWSTRRIEGRYFPQLLDAIQGWRRCHVFRSDGLFYRSYERVYTYPRLLQLPIEEVRIEPLLFLAEELGMPLRQYRNRDGSLPSFRKA